MDHPTSHETLDPKDWDAMRALAHRMVDDALDHVRTARDRPAWRPMPAEVVDAFKSPAPRTPAGAEAAYEEFRANILPYPMDTTHPRFWGWYMGSGTVIGALADLLASTLNSNLGGGNHAANLVEEQVIQWIKDMLGFPTDATGLLVSGGSMANLVGLAVARNTRAGFDVRAHGLRGDTPRLMFYASTEVHSCSQKALELMGLGSNSLRKLPARDDYTCDVTTLREAIAADRAAGHRPVCVIGNAGTINTGAVDDLTALADVCRQENLWFHVDGSIGAVAILAENVKPRLAGIERADSLALDLHKWMHIPFEAGCVLVRSEPAHRATFSLTPEYLAHETRGVAGGSRWFSDYGIQLSRQFRALKVWMSVKEHGLDRFGRMMSRNVDQARYFAGLVMRHPQLELMAPLGALDIVCFRFNPGDRDDDALGVLNKEILMQLHEQGIAVPSYTTLGGRYCLRIAISNHRSTLQDFDALAEAVVRLGATLAAVPTRA